MRACDRNRAVRRTGRIAGASVLALIACALAGCGGGGGSKVVRLGCDQYCAQAGSPQGNGPEASQVAIDSQGTVVASADGSVPITLTCRTSKACDGGVILLSGPYAIAPGLSVDCGPSDGCAGRSNLDVPAHSTRTIGVPLSPAGHQMLSRFGRVTTNVLIEFPPASEKFSPVQLALSADAPRGQLKFNGTVEAMAATPGRLWVATQVSSAAPTFVHQLNAQTGAEIGSPIQLPGETDSMLSVNGQLWIGSQQNSSTALGRIVRIDAASGHQLAPINLDQQGAPDLTAGAGLVWGLVSQGLIAVNPTSGRVSGLLPTGSISPVGFAVTASDIWLADQTQTVRYAVVNGKLTPHSIPDRSWGIGAEGNVIWSLEGLGSTTVNRYNASTGALLGSSQVGHGADQLAFGAGSVWVVNASDDTVTRLSASTGAVQGAPIPVGPAPKAITFGDGTVWVANTGNATVTAINGSTGAVRSISG